MNEVKIVIHDTTIENFFSLLKIDWLDSLVAFEDVAFDDIQSGPWLALDVYDNRGGPMLTLQLRQIGPDLNVQVAATPGGRLVESFKAYLARFYAIEWPTDATMPAETKPAQPAQAPTPKHEGGAVRFDSNAWLIEQHLDHGRPLPELRPEWLELRNQAKKAPLANIDNSMGAVIRVEKQKRAASKESKKSK